MATVAVTDATFDTEVKNSDIPVVVAVSYTHLTLPTNSRV